MRIDFQHIIIHDIIENHYHFEEPQ